MKKLLFVVTAIICLSYVGNAGVKAETSNEVQAERMPDLPQKLQNVNSALNEIERKIK